MKPYVAVFIGGTLGSLFRYAVNMSVGGAFFPWPTFIENASGSLLLGLLTGFFSSRAKHKLIQLMLGTGFCGGYTTMSAFSKETALILHSSSPHIGVLYVAASFVSGLCLAFIGIVFGTRIGRNKERYES